MKCDAVESDREVNMFRRNFCLHFQYSKLSVERMYEYREKQGLDQGRHHNVLIFLPDYTASHSRGY